MQSALKLHHTELEGKRINVELTAGGGGSTGDRKRKIDERNQRVGEQRVRKKEREEEEKDEEDDGQGGEDGEPAAKKNRVRGGRRVKNVSGIFLFKIKKKLKLKISLVSLIFS